MLKVIAHSQEVILTGKLEKSCFAVSMIKNITF